LRRIEGITEKYFRPFNHIRPIPERSLTSLSSNIRDDILAVNDGDITVLEFCSEKLESLHLELVIDEQELQNILTEVTELFDEVKSANVDSDLKTFILDGLEAIRRGIYEFRIRGPERLREAIAEIVGDYWVKHPKPQTAEDEESWERFTKSVGRFIALVKLAHSSAKAVQEFFGPLLLGPSN
jgi:hypothetical protein